jgi:hypothetical protein
MQQEWLVTLSLSETHEYLKAVRHAQQMHPLFQVSVSMSRSDIKQRWLLQMHT